MFKKIISLFVCGAIFFSFAAPCFAAGLSSEYVGTSNWQAFIGRNASWLNVAPFLGTLDFCGSSDDGHHHSTTYDYIERGEGDLVTLHCTCDRCGDSFEVERNDFDSYVSQQYDTYVASLPFNGYDAEGNPLWYPTFDDVAYDFPLAVLSGANSDIGMFSVSDFPVEVNEFRLSLSSSNRYIVCSYAGDPSARLRSSVSSAFGFRSLQLVAPADGFYTALESPYSAYFQCLLEDNTVLQRHSSWSGRVFASANSAFSVQRSVIPISDSSSGGLYFYRPYATINLPAFMVELSADTYPKGSL